MFCYFLQKITHMNGIQYQQLHNYLAINGGVFHGYSRIRVAMAPNDDGGHLDLDDAIAMGAMVCVVVGHDHC
jgi:hypothetical protein